MGYRSVWARDRAPCDALKGHTASQRSHTYGCMSCSYCAPQNLFVAEDENERQVQEINQRITHHFREIEVPRVKLHMSCGLVWSGLV